MIMSKDHNRNWQDDPTPLRSGALEPGSLIYPFLVAVLDEEGKPVKKDGKPEYRTNVPILKLDNIGRREAARVVSMGKIKGIYKRAGDFRPRH